MIEISCLTLILAAGQGTRMKSGMAKVMHKLAGVPMLEHVIGVSRDVDGGRKAVIIGPGMEVVADTAKKAHANLEVYIQEHQLGTAHAVLAAREALVAHDDQVLVLYGDTPLLRRETLVQLLQKVCDSGADIAVLGFEAIDPTGYGRLITDETGQLIAIVEQKDASESEKAISLCNSGVFAFGKGLLPDLLDRIGNDNANGEHYLTDAVGLARHDGLSVETVICEEEEVLGINTRAQLAQAEVILQNRLREKVMADGVTLVDPGTVYLSVDTVIARDVVIEPFVKIGEGVRIEERALIRSFCHIEGALVGKGCVVGPYARLRPGSDLKENVKIGNFVEIKNAEMETGSKANHLSYIGDASVGAGANIGAGTITCNYDGFAKHKTIIGSGAFIGSNSSLVAPVKIGEGSYVGSGSVITKNVSADALAVTRAPQTEREGWAEKFRKLRSHERARKKTTESNTAK